MVRLAAVLYGLFVAAALLWSYLAGRPVLLYDPAVLTIERTAWGLLLGAALALGAVVLSRFALHRFAWARALQHWFGTLIGPLSAGQVTVLAVSSAIGEEALFRGAMQPALGIAATSTLFALLHVPPRLPLWPWPAMAGTLGVAFGYLTRWSGSIAGAVVAHFLINMLNLLHIARSEKLPQPALAPSIHGQPSTCNHEPGRCLQEGDNPAAPHQLPDPASPCAPGDVSAAAGWSEPPAKR